MDDKFQNVSLSDNLSSGQPTQPLAPVNNAPVSYATTNSAGERPGLTIQPRAPQTPTAFPTTPVAPPVQPAPIIVPTIQPSFTPTPVQQPPIASTPPKPKRPTDWKKIGKFAGLIVLGLLIIAGGVAATLNILNSKKTSTNLASRFNTVEIPLGDFINGAGPTLLGTRSLVINGPLRANDSFIISPSGQPSNGSKGQIYYDQTSNQLAYFNGTKFVPVAANDTVVRSVGGLSGQLTLGGGLSASGGQITNTGVLSVQGQTGAVTLTGGTGIAVNGTALSNTGVTSIGGATGDITIGSGLTVANGQLTNSGVVGATAGTGITVTNDGNGNLTISNSSPSSGTVGSPGGTTGRIAKFTGVQTIADSLLSEAGTAVTVNGDLAVTGNLTLSTALGVGSGGTGATALANNGVVVGQGSGALTAVTAASPGLCLVSTGGAPAFSSCSGSAAVTSLNGLTGALTLADASGVGTTITINDASTGQKGIAQFNSTNFSALSGAINTAQNIHTGASPTFVGVNTNTITPSGPLTVGVSGQQFTMQGNASSVISAISGGSTTSLTFQTPTANVNYRLPTATAGTWDVCTSFGNCTGSGGVTGTGTNNQIAKFTSTGSTIGDSIISDNGTTVGIAGVLAVNTITPTGALTIGAVAQNLTLQGASTTLSSTVGGVTSSLIFATPTGGAKTITLPNATGTVVVSATSPLSIDVAGNISCPTCATTGSGVTSLDGLTGALTIANSSGSGSTVTINDASTGQKGIAQFNSTNFSSAGGVVNTIQDISVAATPTFGTLTLSSSQATNPMLLVNNTNASGSGNLIDLQLNSVSRMAISPAGNMTLTGTLNGQTISSAANFTGTLAVAGNTTLTGDVAVNGGDITSTGALNITPGGALTAGVTSQNLTLQGNTNTTLSATNAGNTTTLAFQAPTANVTYRLLTVAAGTYDICSTAGNCTGIGGGVTTPGGTAGVIPKFTSANGIGDSIISDSGTTVTIAGALAVNTITPSAAMTIGATTQNVTLQGAAGSTITATSGSFTTTVSFQTPTANVNYRFPTATAGTWDVCTTFGNCTGSGGVTGTGTNGKIAKFTSTGSTIGDSIMTEAGSTVTVAGSLNVTSGNQFQVNGTQISSANLSNDANLAKLDATQTFTGATNTFQNTSNSTLAFSVQNASSQRILSVDTTGGQAILGQASTVGGKLVFANATNANTITIIPSTAGGNRTITLPDDSGTVCLSTGNCAGAGATLQTAYNNSTDPEITLDATRGALTVRDASTPIGANLLEVQNNAASTTYFAVNSSGTSTTGTSTVSGNINTTGGGLQTGSTTRVDNSGNLTNIGALTLSGAISGGTTYTGSGNINSSGGALQTAGVSRVDNTGNLINIGNITGTGAVTIASTGAGNDVTIDGADQFIVQDAASFNAISTFNNSVNLALSGSQNLSVLSTVTGTTSVNLIGAVLTNNTTSGTQQVAMLQNASGSGSTEGVLVLDNADATNAVTSGLQITSAAGGITNAVDVSDPDIVTALLFGANDIVGTNLSVTGSSGNITSAGSATLQGGTVNVGTVSQAGVLALSDGSNNTGTLAVAALGQNTVYTLPDPGTGTATICLTTGNCAGTGGGVTGTGTAGRIAKFTTTGSTIGDSILSESGSTITVSGNLSVTSGNQFQVNGTQISSANLSNDANLAKLDGTQTFTGVTNTFQNTSNSTLAFSIQNSTAQRLLSADTTGGQVILGQASALAGKLVFANATNANTITIVPSVASTAQTLTLPNETGTFCTTGSVCTGYAASSGAASYIQNQSASDQTADFRISGTGRANTALQSPTIDTPSATALGIGTTNATGINLNQNTVVAATKTLTVTSGLTSLTSNTTGDALNVSNSTSTGNIAVFKDGSTAVATIADNGVTTFQNNVSGDTTAAFRILNQAGDEVFGANTLDSILTLLGNNTGKLQNFVTNSNTLVTARDSADAVYLNGYLYLMGGCTTTTVQYAKVNGDGSTGVWANNSATLPTSNCNGSATTSNGYIYVSGGGTTAANSQQVYYGRPNSDGTVTTWNTAVNALPAGGDLNHGKIVSYNGYLYAFGGQSNVGAVLNQTLYYAKLNSDGSPGSWSQTASWLPAGRRDFGAAIANGYLYVVGGRIASAGAGQTTVYYGKFNADGSIGTASTTTALPSGRGDNVSYILNGHLYSLGGAATGNTETTLMMYAPLNNDGTVGSWTSDTTAFGATGLGVGGVATNNGYVYYVGGFGGTTKNTILYATGSRVKIGGSLDLTGLSGEGMSDGGTGGQLSAGNTSIAGTLNVIDGAVFKSGASIYNTLNVSGTAAIQAITNSTNSFMVTNASGMQIVNVGTVRNAADLVTNGSIETNDTGWTGRAGGVESRVTTQSLFGTASLQVVGTSASDGVKYNVTLADSTTYTISFYALLSSGTFTDMLFGYSSTGAAGGEVDCSNGGQAVQTTGWTKYNCTFTTPGSHSGTPYFYTKTGGLGGAHTTFLDGLQITPTSDLGAYYEGKISTNNGVFSGPLTVQNDNNSTTALAVFNSSGNLTFNVDTTNNAVKIGGGDVGANTTPGLFVLDYKTSTGDPTGLVGAMYYNSFNGQFRCNQATRGWTDCLGVPKPNTRKWAYIIYPGGSATTFDMNGDIVGGNTANAVAATTTEPAMLEYATAATTNSASSMEGNLNYNSSNNPNYQAYIGVPNNTNVRIWAGLTDQAAATMAASGNPAGNYAAFRFDSAGDTNYKCITKNGTTQSVTDSGIVPGTAGRKLEVIVVAGTNVVFKIDGVTVCTNTNFLPAASTMMRYTNTVTALANSSVSVRSGWVYVESEK